MRTRLEGGGLAGCGRGKVSDQPGPTKPDAPPKARRHVPRQPSTYARQLRAFTGAILRGEQVLTGADDAVDNMTVIDACYAAAGLPRREPSP